MTEASLEFVAIGPRGYIPIPLRPDKLQDVIQARLTVLFAEAFEQKLDMVLENYATLERFILDLALRNAVFGGDSLSRLTDSRHHVNRHLTNLLSSARLYLDQTAHAISLRFGKESQIYATFQQERKEQYDSSLSYRLMEALRNYVQHRGLPAHAISFSGSRVELPDGSTRNRHTVDYALSPSQIRADGGFKSRVLTELESVCDEKGLVELMPHVREYISRLAVVHKSAQMRMPSHVGRADACLEELFKLVYTISGNQCGAGKVFEKRGPEMIEVATVSLDWIGERKSYVQKNLYAEYIRYQFVSS